MKKKIPGNWFYNYGLTLLFIVVIIAFLLILVLMSRFVFSDVSPIGEHVLQTKDLLKNIDEVKSRFTNESGGDFADFNLNFASIPIGTVSVVNVNENRSFFSIELPGEVKRENEYYYLNAEIGNLGKGDLVLFKREGELETGRIATIENEGITVISLEDSEFYDLNKDNYVGVFLLKKNE
ncbi:MAG: hypothetical protein ACOCXG_00900 [Nanoarchaeota archaeon]